VTATEAIRRNLSRTGNRWYDLLAIAHGYCNRRSRTDDTPAGGGGYTHWRCALRRRHNGMHRYGNYVWTDDGAVDYLPAPVGSGKEAWQPKKWDRSLTPTRRQARAMRQWVDGQHKKRHTLTAPERPSR
jgi:hypothetical protein